MNKQICLYGGPGVGKTSAIRTLAKHLWKTKQQKTLVVTFDGGGAGPLEAGVKAGAIELIQLPIPKSPFVTFKRLAQGFRPEDSSMLKWKKIDWQKENIGAYVHEGLPAWSSAIMDWARDKHANGIQIGQMDGGKLGFFEDGEGVDKVKLGSNTMTHYGIAQSYMKTFIHDIKNLWQEGLENILWTALECKSLIDTQDKGPVPAYGPLFVGNAATKVCTPWFTHIIHLDIVNARPMPNGTISGDRKFFMDWHKTANDPIPYVGKFSVDPDGKAPTVIDPDFGVFFNELEKANKLALEGWK